MQARFSFFISYLNNGIPSPIIKNAKIMDDISVAFPNPPDIIDCNILSVTLGIVMAPRVPIRTYKQNAMEDDPFNADNDKARQTN